MEKQVAKSPPFVVNTITTEHICMSSNMSWLCILQTAHPWANTGVV